MRLPAAPLTLVLVVSAAGCSTRSPAPAASEPPRSVVSAPASSLASAPSDTSAVRPDQLSGKDLASKVSAALRGAASYRMTTQTPVGGSVDETVYDVDLSSGRSVVRTVLADEGGSAITVVGDTEKVYARSPSFGSDRWFLVTTKSPNAGVRNISSGAGEMLRVGEPATTVAALRSSGVYSQAGETEIAGVPTVAYRGNISVSAVRRLLPGVGSMVTGPTPVQMWLDKDWIPRRSVIDLQLGTTKITYTQVFSRIGQVEVKLPAA